LTKLEATESFRGLEQARSCAQAGLSIAVATVRDANDLSTDRRLAGLRGGQAVFPVGEGTCSIRIAGESGRLNVNSLKDKNGRLDRRRIDQMLRLIDLVNRKMVDSERIKYGLVPALIDWTDDDDEVTRLPFISHGSKGAENAYYAALSPSYRCKNRPLDTIEELRSVRGVTPKAFAALRELLTTSGDGQININTAPSLVLQSLSEQMDPALSAMIVQRREIRPFNHVAELKDVPGMTDNIYQAIRNAVSTRSAESYYRIRSQGKVGGQICRIEALLRRNTQTGNVDIIQYRES
jgi:general secretion pathway protein K